jgi:hypothetical protein
MYCVETPRYMLQPVIKPRKVLLNLLLGRAGHVVHLDEKKN